MESKDINRATRDPLGSEYWEAYFKYIESDAFEASERLAPLQSITGRDICCGFVRTLITDLEAERDRLAEQIPNAAYCNQCDETQPLIDEEMRTDDLNPHPWRDLTCSVCRLVINSVSRIPLKETNDD